MSSTRKDKRAHFGEEESEKQQRHVGPKSRQEVESVMRQLDKDLRESIKHVRSLIDGLSFFPEAQRVGKCTEVETHLHAVEEIHRDFIFKLRFEFYGSDQDEESFWKNRWEVHKKSIASLQESFDLEIRKLRTVSFSRATTSDVRPPQDEPSSLQSLTPYTGYGTSMGATPPQQPPLSSADTDLRQYGTSKKCCTLQ